MLNRALFFHYGSNRLFDLSVVDWMLSYGTRDHIFSGICCSKPNYSV
jgi:hypothetical protein